MPNDIMRLNTPLREQAKRSGFTHAVVTALDVSVEMVGSVHSLFRKEGDAKAEAKRLSDMYGVDNSFLSMEL